MYSTVMPGGSWGTVCDGLDCLGVQLRRSLRVEGRIRTCASYLYADACKSVTALKLQRLVGLRFLRSRTAAVPGTKIGIDFPKANTVRHSPWCRELYFNNGSSVP